MRESQIEREDRKRHKEAGGRMVKFTSPGLVGVPDNLVLYPIPPEHQELVAKYLHFAEYKKLDKKPNGPQQRRHAELRAMGFRVDVVDRIEGEK